MWLPFLFTGAYILQLLSFLLSPSPTTHLLHHSISKSCPLPLQPFPQKILLGNCKALAFQWAGQRKCSQEKGKPVIKIQVSNSFCSPIIKTLSLFSVSIQDLSLLPCALGMFSPSRVTPYSYQSNFSTACFLCSAFYTNVLLNQSETELKNLQFRCEYSQILDSWIASYPPFLFFFSFSLQFFLTQEQLSCIKSH